MLMVYLRRGAGGAFKTLRNAPIVQALLEGVNREVPSMRGWMGICAVDTLVSIVQGKLEQAGAKSQMALHADPMNLRFTFR